MTDGLLHFIQPDLAGSGMGSLSVALAVDIDIAPTGPEAVFGAERANTLFERIESFNRSAVA